MKKIILSISFCYHDSAITIADEEKILLHLEAERFYKEKHKRFKNLDEVDKMVKYALDYLDINILDVSEVLITKWNNLYKSNNVKILGRKFDAILTNHHENHIGTIFPSNYEKSVILVSDGGSEDGVIKLYYKDKNNIKFIEDLEDKLFTGKFYGTIAQMIIEPKCSIAHQSGVGKLMGLSSLGKYDKEIEKKLIKYKEELNKLHFEGVEKLNAIFDLDSKYSEVWKNEYKKNIAHTAHNLWVNKCAEYLKKHNKFSRNICIVGGCALNISLNSKLLEDKIYDNLYISPISTDAGQSLGAILYKYPKIKCTYPYLGVGKEISHIKKINIDKIVKELVDGNILSWYQEKSEIGARALGHRSFLGIPTSEDMRIKISEKIKKREPYRPVAAIIPRDLVSDYFYQDYDSPYMTFCAKAKDITKKLAPAIVHADGTTRVQTLTQNDNPLLYRILMELKEKIGVPILMNTSFNVMGAPIVNSEEDAIKMHKISGSDQLYINGLKRDNKKCTIIIPTYNNNDSLEKTLKSMQKVNIFNDKEIEVLIVQNHESLKVYLESKKLENKYNIKVYHEIKPGKAAALNKGIKNCMGEYIISIDDDVIITDNQWIKKFINEFEKNSNLGYVSGNVLELKEESNLYTNLWEKKGGLSKGKKEKYWSYEFLNSNKFKIFPWPLHKLCAGANQMIRTKVLYEIGGYSEFLGRKDTVDGLTLEIGYKIAKAGYELLYNPNIYLYHKHPKEKNVIKKKLFYYGMQDTGVSMYIFLKHKDIRYLWWSLFGHTLYTFKKIFKSFIGTYPLGINYLIYGLLGNLCGGIKCFIVYSNIILRRSLNEGNI